MMTLHFFSICVALRTKSMQEYLRPLVETCDRNRRDVRWSVLYSSTAIWSIKTIFAYSMCMMTRSIFAQRKRAVSYRRKSCWSRSSWLGIWDMTRHMMQLSVPGPENEVYLMFFRAVPSGLCGQNDTKRTGWCQADKMILWLFAGKIRNEIRYRKCSSIEWVVE